MQRVVRCDQFISVVGVRWRHIISGVFLVDGWNVSTAAAASDRELKFPTRRRRESVRGRSEIGWRLFK